MSSAICVLNEWVIVGQAVVKKVDNDIVFTKEIANTTQTEHISMYPVNGSVLFL